MYECAQMDANDAKQEIARSHKNPAQDVNEDNEVCFCKWMDRLSRVWTQVHGWRIRSGTRPEVANTIFLVVLCRYRWFCTVELRHQVEPAAEPP